MEEGTLVFIGATTENPSFELNNALLSRARVYVLKALELEDLEGVMDQALADRKRGLGPLGLTLAPEQRRVLAEAADGDARRALNLLELAADAYLACGSSRTDRLALEGLASKWLPEDPARGNVGHSKRRHCVQGAVLIAAGAEPEDTGWWSADDLWRHALDAVVVFVRAAADRRGETVETVCVSLRPN